MPLSAGDEVAVSSSVVVAVPSDGMIEGASPAGAGRTMTVRVLVEVRKVIDSDESSPDPRTFRADYAEDFGRRSFRMDWQPVD
ncbi:MAG: hypothetical protein ACREFO_06045, partial [Acetobacteraceae bacterium]